MWGGKGEKMQEKGRACVKNIIISNVRGGHGSFWCGGGYRGSGVAQPGGKVHVLEYRTPAGTYPTKGGGGQEELTHSPFA